MSKSSITRIILFLLCSAQFTQAQLVYTVFRGVREVNTGIQWGGRTWGLAVNPANSNVVVAATNTGGIKRTMNRGVSWTHMNNFPCRETHDIAYADNTGNNIIVTTGDDFKAVNGAGIWRSEDGGNNWTQCPVTFTNPASSCNDRMVAWNITKSAGRILVATGCGIAISTDGGRTFTHKNVAGSEGAFLSIAASGNRVIIGGDRGIFYSGDEGDNFTRETTGIGNMDDFHGMAWSDNFGAGTPIAYAVNSASALYYSIDAGQTWRQISSAPAGGGSCGGTRFIAAIKTGSASQKLYYGNRCGASLLNVNRALAGGNYNFNYSGSWTTLNFQHGADCYQVLFDGANPYMLATDGGVEGTTDGGLNWTSIGKASSGFNALQLMDVKGQMLNVGGVRRQTLYFGTQDNDLWASNNGITSFPNSTRAEGFNFQMARNAISGTGVKIHYITCFGCGNRISDPLFASQVDWPNISNPLNSPILLKEGTYVQFHQASGLRRQGVSITNNNGGAWRNLVNFSGTLRGEPKIGKTSSGYVIYQGVLTGNQSDGTNADIVQLAKINSFNETGGATPAISFAAMRNFGSMGLMPTMWPWYEVYGIDYSNSNNIIAADYTNRKMKRSRNGGDDWEDLDGLTSLITDGGRLNFRFSNNAGGGLGRFTQTSLVSYNPEISGYVIVGTQEGGVFFSSDNGDNWVQVPFSEKISTITSAYWTSTGKIYIGSYGRGLWEISYEIRNQLEDMPRLCREPCWLWVDPRIRAINPKLNEDRISHVIVARDGVIRGWRTGQKNELQEIMVSPGTQVVYYDSKNAKQPDIKITEIEKYDKYPGADEMVYEQLKKQMNLQGLSVRDGEIGELMFTQKMIEKIQSEPVKFTADLQKKSADNEGRPSLQVLSRNMINGIAVVPAGEVDITVTGTLFSTDKTPVEILVDNQRYATAYPDQSGTFSINIKGKFNVGHHGVKAIQKTANGVITISNSFLCNNSDK